MPQNLAAPLHDTLRGLDAGLPLTLMTWQKSLDSALFAARTATVSLGVLGVLGAMLAVTGIFGMASYSVSKRLRELGIRVALGARRKEVLQAALGRTFRLMAAGQWQVCCWAWRPHGYWVLSSIKPRPEIRRCSPESS